ncbi:hypothetical protein F4821DRAFT_279166 [Hypoxylon rubiginosum]|uniref:Uncharacterized protein n=1 Tax=Hypoxylon rubiginosum TaxID=110542 RepID=A0ACC0CYV1_9PEZI|nr:hypothetical protein F4821DRAFT_279166 [Hypoxylon rubiginosum]
MTTITYSLLDDIENDMFSAPLSRASSRASSPGNHVVHFQPPPYPRNISEREHTANITAARRAQSAGGASSTSSVTATATAASPKKETTTDPSRRQPADKKKHKDEQEESYDDDENTDTDFEADGNIYNCEIHARVIQEAGHWSHISNGNTVMARDDGGRIGVQPLVLGLVVGVLGAMLGATLWSWRKP